MIKLDNETKLVPFHMTELYKNYRIGSNYINTVPREIILEIFKYLEIEDLGEVAQVCRQWNLCNQDDTLWRFFLKRDFWEERPVAKAKEVYRRYHQLNIHLSRGIYATRTYQILNSCPPVINEKQVIFGREQDIEILNLATGKQEQTLKGHTEKITSLLLTKEGKLISSSLDKTIKIWNLKEGYCEQTVCTGRKAGSFAVTEQKIIGGFDDGTIKIWEKGYEKTLSKDKDIVCQLLLISEEKLISRHCNGHLEIWNLNTGRCEETLETASIWDGFQTPNTLLQTKREKLAYIPKAESDKIQIRDLNSGKEWTLNASTSPVTYLLETNEEKLICGSSNGNIKIWDLHTFKWEKELIGHECRINNLFQIHKKLISCSNDGVIKIWNLENGHRQQILSTSFLSHSFTKEGQFISVSDGNVGVKLEVMDFNASNEEVFAAIAYQFLQYSTQPHSQRCTKVSKLLEQFAQMPEKERNEIYDALYQKIKFSFQKDQAAIWGYGEKAFHDREGCISTLWRKAEAICDYLQSKEQCEEGKIAVFFTTGLYGEGMERFLKLPKVVQNRIYEELYHIIQSSLKEDQKTWGCAEKAFHSKERYFSTNEDKAQAIRNYIDKIGKQK